MSLDEDSSLLDSLFEVDDFLESPQYSQELFTSQPTHITENNGENGSHTRELPLFNCYISGKNTLEFPANGFIKSGLLSRLLSGELPVPGVFNEPQVSLFGHMTVTCQVVLNDLDVNFLCFRRHLNTVLAEMTDPSTSGDPSVSMSYCTNFLHFIDNHTAELTITDNNLKPHPFIINIMNNVLTHFKHVLVSLDPLDQLLLSAVDGFPPIFHCLLHILWCTVCISYRLLKYSSQSPGGGVSNVVGVIESCDQVIQLLMKERNSKFNITQSGNAVLFQCSCAKEVWLLVAMVVDRLSTDFNTESFWSLLSQTFSQISSPTFAWFVIVQVSLLYKCNPVGIANNGEKVMKMDWKLIHDLVSHTLKTLQESKHECELRWCLKCLLFVFDSWATPSLTPVMLLWGHYHKFINESFQHFGLGIKSTISSDNLSSVDWYKYVNDVVCIKQTGVFNGVEDGRTSFEVFLQIVFSCLKHGSHGNQLWRQMKSRFYSKFSQRKVLELNPNGVRHMVTLFLVLVQGTKSEEPAAQLFTFLSYHKLSNDRRSLLIWKGILTLLMTCVELSVVPPDSLVTKVTGNMAGILPMSPSTTNINPSAVEIASAILDGLYHLLEIQRGVVSTWTRPLYGPFTESAISCPSTFTKSVNFIKKTVNLLSTEFSFHSSPSSMETNMDHEHIDKLKSFSRSLWQHVYPPMVKVLESTTYSCSVLLLAQVLKDMTIFASTCISDDDANGILTKVGLPEAATPSDLPIHYLNALLTEDISCMRTSIDTQFRICHSWLKGLITLGTDGQSITQLTSQLLKLDSIKSLIGSHGNCQQDVSQPLTLFLLIIKGVASQYSAAVTMEDKYVWKKRLSVVIGESYTSYYELVSTNNYHLKLYYKLSSALVRHCSPLIYSKSSTRCLLPQILDTLVLPVVSTRRPLPQILTSQIKSHLHHFLTGLFTLEPDKDEFIKRKIKQIFSRYFRRYAEPPSPIMVGSGASQFNPFMTFLNPSFIDNPSLESREVLLTSLEIIVTQELLLPQKPSLMVPCFLFIHSLLSRIVCTDLLLKCVPILLIRTLSCLLLCIATGITQETDQLRKEAMNCLKVLMDASKNRLDKSQCSEFLLPLVDQYITVNIFDHKRDVFKPLVALVTYNPTLSSGISEVIQSVVNDYESKKGSGVDKGLRTVFEDFKKSISRIC